MPCATRRRGEIILKVVNPGASAADAKINLAGVTAVESSAKATLLASEKLSAENSMAAPQNISPVQSTLNNAAKEFTYNFAPRSVTVLRLKAK